MTKTTMIVTDKNFRITIPENLRIAEKLNQGDMIEIEVKNIGKPENWDCKDDILTEVDQNYVQRNSKRFEKIAIVILSPAVLEQRINVYGIKLTLKDADNNEIPDDTILILRKEDKYFGNSSPIGKYEYGDLKSKVTLRNKASLSFEEVLAIYPNEKYVGKEIHSETIRFYVDSCVKKI